MNSLHQKQMKVGGLDVHYVQAGHGDPLIVIHGGANGAGAWKKNVAELAKKYTVYLPDLPGFGQSQEMDGDYYIPELVEFVEGFSNELGLKKFYLMGHSMGGAVAVSYALKFPGKVLKLVLVSSMCIGKEIALWVRLFSSPVLSYSIGRIIIHLFRAVKWVSDRIISGIEIALPFSRTSIRIGTAATTFHQQTMVLAPRLCEITAPTLVVWGARDPIVPAMHAWMAGALIPECEVKVFEDCGHSVYRQKVDEFSDLVNGFLG
ncbi:MAG: alpha/beta fold hydrolase [Chloroflexota bacterium]|nr:alpha/beta fold hydrolase [Chloroflexota bacterium]